MKRIFLNADKKNVLAFCGDSEVWFADFTSSGEGITMMVRISGSINAIIAPPFMIFRNKDGIYSIREVIYDVPRVIYRTQPKFWIDKRYIFSGSNKSVPTSLFRMAKKVRFI